MNFSFKRQKWGFSKCFHKCFICEVNIQTCIVVACNLHWFRLLAPSVITFIVYITNTCLKITFSHDDVEYIRHHNARFPLCHLPLIRGPSGDIRSQCLLSRRNSRVNYSSLFLEDTSRTTHSIATVIRLCAWAWLSWRYSVTRSPSVPLWDRHNQPLYVRDGDLVGLGGG